jgi:hypothetical protein
MRFVDVCSKSRAKLATISGQKCSTVKRLRTRMAPDWSIIGCKPAPTTHGAPSEAIDGAADGHRDTVQDMWRAALAIPLEAGSCARVSHWRSRPAASSGVGP